MNAKKRVGFMQGRLSPIRNAQIQAFPWDDWRREFEIGEQHGFGLMEWTLDQERLYENPLMNEAGQVEIRDLCALHGVRIASLTGDCFMQAPFWKSKGRERENRERDFLAVAVACSAVGVEMMVVPLVDNGTLENADQEDQLVNFLQRHCAVLCEQNVRVVFESDFAPLELARFIDRLDADWFGINYDIGNSAASGFKPEDEFSAYAHRIDNVHVKDRPLAGTTVPLGEGDADFGSVFSALGKIGYAGNYILQTARAKDADHAGVLCRYRDMSVEWMNTYGS